MKLKIFELIEFILWLLIFVDVMAGYVSSKTCIGWICERMLSGHIEDNNGQGTFCHLFSKSKKMNSEPDKYAV